MSEFILGDSVAVTNWWGQHGKVIRLQRNVDGVVTHYKVRMHDETLEQAKYFEACKLEPFKDCRQCVCGGDSLRDPLHAWYCQKGTK